MSDLYDSLEDENDEKKPSCDDSPDQFKGEAPCCPSKGAYRSKSVHHYPFYLNQKLSKDNVTAFPYFSAAFKNSSLSRQQKNFLPRINDKLSVKGQEQVQKIVVDNQILNKQGLQLNNDGSFTRSPRPEEEEEELPFISREYRDLHLLKHKANTPVKKSRSVKIKTNNKNLFSFTDNPVDGISMNVLISARKKKGSSEEILVSESSQRSSRSKSNKGLSRENLTDSMKEKLLNRTLKNNQALSMKSDNTKNVKRESKVQGKKEMHAKNGARPNPNSLPNKSPPENSNSVTGSEVRVKPKSVDRKVPRYRSDFAMNPEKPKLNYSERLKLQNGYNPLHLRLGCLATKKVPTDTNRSNFGDSTVDQLSGVSSGNHSIENFMDEDEEKYYRKLMEMDRNRKRRAARSSRSEGPIDFINLKEMKPSAYKTEMRNPYEPRANKNNTKNKHAAKSLSLDMPFKPENVKYSKKTSHLCLGGSSTNWSKAELALKAKTYGYMVNARNIFKLKAQSETTSPPNKSPGRSGKSKSGKAYPQPNNSPVVQPSKEKVKKRTPLPESLPKVRQSSFAGVQDLQRRKQPSGGAKLSAGRRESQIHFFLPEVRNLSSGGVQMKTDKLDGLSACFKSPKR